MFYAIIATDIKHSLQRRLAARPAHLARLEQLKQEGRLLAAGSHPTIDGETRGLPGSAAA